MSETPTPPSLPHAGYLSEESKRQFTMIAGILGAVAFFGQFIVPMVGMLILMPMGMFTGVFNMKMVDTRRAVSPVRAAAGSWNLLLSHECPIPALSSIEEMTVAYPAREQTWLGLGMPWWLFFLIVSLVTALALRRRLGVVI